MKAPTTVLYLSFGVATVSRLAKREKGVDFERILAQVPAALLPTHCGFAEPVKERFELQHAGEQLRPLWDSDRGAVACFLMRGESRGRMTVNSSRGPMVIQNSLTIDLELLPIVERDHLASCMQWFSSLVEWADGAYAAIRVGAGYRDGGVYEEYEPKAIEWRGVLVDPVGPIHVTLECLSLDGWINVLGREYIELLGKEKLHALALHRSWEDKGGRLWLQFAEHAEQMYSGAMKDRMATLADELGASDVLCRPSRTRSEVVHGIRDYRTPRFDRSQIRIAPLSDIDRCLRAGRWLIEWAPGSVKAAAGSIASHVLAEMIVFALKERARIEPFGATIDSRDNRSLVRHASPHGCAPDQMVDELIQDIKREATAGKLWGAGVCLVEFQAGGKEQAAPIALRMVVEYSHGGERGAMEIRLPLRTIGRKLEAGALWAQRVDPRMFVESARELT